MISYDKLWRTMRERGITQYALIKKYNISPGQITRLKRNESVSTHAIDTFCRILHCDVSDVMEYIEDTGKRPASSLRPAALVSPGPGIRSSGRSRAGVFFASPRKGMARRGRPLRRAFSHGAEAAACCIASRHGKAGAYLSVNTGLLPPYPAFRYSESSARYAFPRAGTCALQGLAVVFSTCRPYRGPRGPAREDRGCSPPWPRWSAP